MVASVLVVVAIVASFAGGAALSGVVLAITGKTPIVTLPVHNHILIVIAGLAGPVIVAATGYVIAITARVIAGIRA